MKSRNIFSFILVGIILFALVLGCGSSQTCIGELTIDGKKYNGTDSKPEQAKRNACSKYCIDGDPAFDALHRKWLDSPESKKVVDPENKWSAYALDEDLNTFVEKCHQKCVQADRDGTQKIDVKCQ